MVRLSGTAKAISSNEEDLQLFSLCAGKFKICAMMLTEDKKETIRQKLSNRFSNVDTLQFQSIGGGSINETYRISFGNQMVFCKVNSASKFPLLFQKEQQGLKLLASQNIIETPSVLDCFENANTQFLLLEWVTEGERTERFWKDFGEQLATLHRVTSSSFGLGEDNYMGSVPQQNDTHSSWTLFFCMQRLKPMIERCFAKDLLNRKHVLRFESLQKKLSGIFNEEKPSLLHGDLWSGNFMCNASSKPVLIDPAVYFGHRSADLAMTTLFGGFRQSFYAAYHYHFPLPDNYEEQWAICNLYPLLIHLYLFGSGYLPQIERTLKQFE